MSEKSVTFAETYWLEANKYQIWKNAPKWENSANIEFFLFLFDENKDRVLVSGKNNSGAKYIKLADIATLTQLDGILTSPLTSEVVQNR